MITIGHFEKHKVSVAPFLLHDQHLAVLTIPGEDGPELPHTPIRPHHFRSSEDMLTAAARDVLYTAYGDAQPTLEPLLIQGKVKSDNNYFRLGYAAVTNLLSPSEPATHNLVPLHQIFDPSVNISPYDREVIEEGLNNLRPPSNISWVVALGEPKFQFILSRLLSNPRKFTTSEIRIAYEALLFDAPRNVETDDRPDVQANFTRAIEHSFTDLVNLGIKGPPPGGKGRPASMWAMPQRILSTQPPEGTLARWSSR